MKENKVIACLLADRQAFENVAKYYDDTDFSDMGKIIWTEIKKYYERDDNAASCDSDAVLNRICRGHPKSAEKFDKFFGALPEVSTANVLQDYLDTKLDSLGELAGGYLIAGEHKRAADTLAKYNQLVAEGLTESSNEQESEVYIGAEADSFVEAFDTSKRIPLHPKEMNEQLKGGLIAGSHTLIYAPPETGKTAMAITQAFRIAYGGKRVLYCGNEEAANMYLMRMKSRFSGMTEEEIKDNPELADEKADANGWGNLIFAHMSPGNTDEVKKLALDHEVEVVILDQIHNLKHSQYPKLEGTQLLTALAYTMRMFFSKHKIAGISFTQADEKAIGKLHLGIKDVYYSNIGVQGQTDVMIGMGMNDDYQRLGRRVLNFTKNKIGGSHDYVTVQINGELSSIKSMETK